MEFVQYSPRTPGYAHATGPVQMRRSCEACRAFKSRCYSSTEDLKQCQRCVMNGQDCVYLEAKPRPKKSKTSRARVAEMEQKLHGIFALLSSGHACMPSDIQSSHSSLAHAFPEISSMKPASSTIRPGASTVPSSLWSLPDSAGIGDVIEKGIISFEQAKTCLDDFKTHASSFPFVVMPPHMPLDLLRREKPFLLLAILAMATQADPKLQDRLELVLRESLSQRVVLNGEKSLDLLQGLLVYLNWYHFYLRPERQQIYQLSQMTISMAVDLGITKPGKRHHCAHPYIDHTAAFGQVPTPSTRGTDSESLELKRTFLGCYYQSSCLSTAFRKPLALRHTDHIEHCCRDLSVARENQSDALIPYLIRVQRLAEDINQTFDYDEHQQLPEMDRVRIETHLKSFNRQISDIEQNFPIEVWSNGESCLTTGGTVADYLLVPITHSMNHLRIYVNEIALHSSPSTFDLTSGQASCLNWHSSACRTESLIRCVEAAKVYLDQYFTLSSDQIRNFTFPEHIKSFYALITISIFAAGIDSPMAEQLTTAANMEYYISAITDRAAQLVTIHDGEEQKNFFYHVRTILSHTQKWFLEHGQDVGLLHQGSLDPDLAFMLQSGNFEQCQLMDQSLTCEGAGDMWTGDMLDDDWQLDLVLHPNSLVLDKPI